LAALLASLLFVLAYPLPAVRDDAVEYLALARNLASGNGFTMDGSIPAVYRPPLFSALLGGWFFLTDTSSVASAAIFQSLVHAAGVLAVFLLFLELTPSLTGATFAALFLAVNPLLVTRVGFVLQEPTLLLFTTLAAYLSLRMVKAPSAPRAALTGAAWGVCTLAKVVAWFIPFVLLAMHFLPGRLRREWKGREAAALLLCFAAVVVPWTARNYVHFHRFIPVNDEGAGMVAWAVSNARIPGEPAGEAYLKKMDSEGLSPDDRKELLWKYIRDHPRYFLVNRIAKNVVHFAAPSRDWWIATGRARLNEHGALYWTLAALFHVPLYLLLLLRSGQWWRGRASPALGFLVLLYLAYWAQYSLIYGDPRFGIPVYPVLVGVALASTRSTAADGRRGEALT
jgi:4-amino-4-deoxy-L-arabinose transferase-like glycosyltransferase